ncbi:MAG: cytidylate kinase-like family protein [Gemmatimonadetes bacterium]|nr:cytidylate kinase-like family protein [Gemmatimonadota bacterium]
MAVITVSRQYGSGGAEIAKLVGQRLGWTVIDNEFVELVAQRSGLPAAEVERLEERVPGMLERLAQALALASPEVFVVTGETPTTGPTPEEEVVRFTEAVINEAVKHDHVVLVGRGAQAYLAQRENTLHVFIVAPREVRVRRAMERLTVDRKEAERTVDEIDHSRRQYVKTYYGRVWDSPENYHMVLNGDRLTYDEIADLTVAAVKKRGWK